MNMLYYNSNKMFKTLFNLYNICIILCLLDISETCRFGSDPNCAFPCHCINENECLGSEDCFARGQGCRTSEPSYYYTGWEGLWCLTGNVAYGKHSSQSSNFEGSHPAVLGIDGKAFCDDSTQLAQTTPDNPAWYKVELDGRYMIYNVTIHDRADEYDISNFVGSQIQVIDHDDVQINDCGTITTENYAKVMTFTCNSVGDTVKIERSLDGSVIQICELVVYGHLYIAWTSKCDEWDNDILGCKTCQAGKKLPDCAHDCPWGYYGVNCEYECNNCEPCDPVSGKCLGECNGWYVGEMCDTELVQLPLYPSQITDTTTSSSITITWRAGESPFPGTKLHYHYSIEYKRLHYGPTKDIPVIPLIDDKASEQSYTIENLQHNSDYVYYIYLNRVIGSVEEGVRTPGRTIKTKCKAPTIRTVLTISKVDDYFNVEWQGDLNTIDSGCDSMSLTLDYKFSADGSNGGWQSLEIMNTSRTSITIPSYGNEHCWVRLRAVNNEQLESSSWVSTSDESKTTEFPPDQGYSSTTQTHTSASVTQGIAAKLLYTAISLAIIAMIIAVVSVVGVVLYVKKIRNQILSSSNTVPLPPNNNTRSQSDVSNPRLHPQSETSGSKVYLQILQDQSVPDSSRNREYYNVDSAKYDHVQASNNTSAYVTPNHTDEPAEQTNAVYQTLD